MSYELQALADARWSWLHLADERVEATYPTRVAAERALDRIAETTSWHRDALRVVRVQRRERPAKLLTLSPEAWDRADAIAARWGTSRSGAIERLIRGAALPRAK